jgi:hypothetical protein
LLGLHSHELIVWNILTFFFLLIYLASGEGAVNLVESDRHGHTTCSTSGSMVPIFDVTTERKLWVVISLKKPIEVIMHNTKYLKFYNPERYLQRSRIRLSFTHCTFLIWLYGLKSVTLYQTWNCDEIYDLQLLLSGRIICSPSVVNLRGCRKMNSEFQDDRILLVVYIPERVRSEIFSQREY